MSCVEDGLYVYWDGMRLILTTHITKRNKEGKREHISDYNILQESWDPDESNLSEVTKMVEDWLDKHPTWKRDVDLYLPVHFYLANESYLRVTSVGHYSEVKPMDLDPPQELWYKATWSLVLLGEKVEAGEWTGAGGNNAWDDEEGIPCWWWGLIEYVDEGEEFLN